MTGTLLHAEQYDQLRFLVVKMQLQILALNSNC